MYRQEKVLVVVPLMLIICDNPRASELVNHLGSAANKFCCICEVRLTRGLRQTRGNLDYFGELFPPSGLNDHSCCFSYLRLSTYLQLPYGVIYRFVLSDNSANMLRQVPLVFLCSSWSIALLIPLYWFSVYKIVSYNIRFASIY